ncbi:8908_t:CDS:2 [Racocetra fulgida]|uniref:8908_t:CDS:1 n=1 Tax=Racocetra fulgida TaxID=60492 RepID=A0A9N8YVS1_9GLOM|nr:8908_t:CDS:2 [Racocetra fulgida]
MSQSILGYETANNENYLYKIIYYVENLLFQLLRAQELNIKLYNGITND